MTSLTDRASVRRHPAVLANALWTAYLTALLFDFRPLVERHVSMTHIFIPTAIRRIATFTDLTIESQGSLVVAAFVLGVLFTPVLRHRLAYLNQVGRIHSLHALVPAFAYTGAITFGLSLLTTFWQFIVIADDSNVASRLGLAVAGAVFYVAEFMIAFAPVMIIATVSISFLNILVFRLK